MIEAVENQSPDIIVVDELSNRDECNAARTITGRGVAIVATVHGDGLASLLGDHDRSLLVGGVVTLTLTLTLTLALTLALTLTLTPTLTPTLTLTLTLPRYEFEEIDAEVQGLPSTNFKTLEYEKKKLKQTHHWEVRLTLK